ncbi:right-handed parallel beta-helix repeat-containing protein [Bacillus sonorensis]|nr:right-handed parallel beta-helix repeat-containing protein [Bacillus sonorensis]WPP37167.1 right-handed parallel beta-helix repeat-containing protein [Bacillus sonorensis]
MPDRQLEDMTMIIADVTKFGAVGDGKTDSTKAINECLDWTKSMGLHTVWIPNGVYLIDGTLNDDPGFPFRNGGINVPSNISILMDAETVIKIKPNSSWGYSAFYIGGESNVKITGGAIIGDRDEHTYTASPRPTHEWGFGICVEGASNVLIENVRIADFTGDGIIISAGGQGYKSSERVTVRNCEISRSRRNNISMTGCDGVLIEGCSIVDAGTGNGTSPRFGIDIEGYSEGAVIYEKPVNIIIRNNTFKGNVNSAVTNFNGASVRIEGNQTDGTISYGYGTGTIISGNIIENNPEVSGQNTGISGQGANTSGSTREAVIKGNLISGFSTGIDIRGENVFVSGNKIINFENAGISVYQATNVFIEGNDIKNGVPEKKMSIGLSMTQSVNITFSNNNIANVILAVRSEADDAHIKQNVITRFSRGIWISQGSAVIDGNFISPASFQIVPESYSISVTNQASAVIQNNSISGFTNFPIYCSTEKQTKLIRNTIEDSPLVVTIYITNGTHEIVGNTITLMRASRPAVILYLTQSSGTAIMNNTIRSRSADGITAIQTNTSRQSMILGNTIAKGTIQSHQTDVVSGNVIV